MKKEELRKIIDENLKPLLPKSKQAVLWELPYHPNLGDTLIWQGEECFLEEGDVNIIGRNSFRIGDRVLGRRLSEDVTIFLHGGGNFGDIWLDPMEFRRKVVAKFTENPIVLFPQTVFYQNLELAERDAKLFAKHENLTLCARDKFSYDFLKKYFFKNNILMVPDMAFYIKEELLATSVKKTTRNLFGSRVDKEFNPSIDYKKYLPKTYQTADWPTFDHPPEAYNETIRMIKEGDISADDYAVKYFMPEMVKIGVNFLSQYSNIFSTRLHIAILATLLGKEVTWFDNSYGKNSDFYETWLKGEKNIKFIYSDLLNADKEYSFEKRLADKRGIQHLMDLPALPLVSVIVPIYNVEKYLSECLDSILNQTYRNIEIICVNDASLDKSGEIADKYSTQDSRIKVIHKSKNEGLNMARATGFKNSTGELIMFVDSDDLITPGCVEDATRLQMKYGADFVRFDSYSYIGGEDVGDVEGANSMSINEEFIEGRRDLFRANLTKGTITVWGALYTRNAVGRVDWTLSNYRMFEDNFWSLYLLQGVMSGVYINKVGYMYRTSDGREGDVLSRRSTGNNFNGKPVGYFEFVHLLLEQYRKYDKEYDLQCEDAIRSVEDWHWRHRLGQISKMEDWEPEPGDSLYIIKLLRWAEGKISTLEADSAGQSVYIDQLNKDIKESENRTLEFLGIKRSLRLFLGNVKRRIRRGFE